MDKRTLKTLIGIMKALRSTAAGRAIIKTAKDAVEAEMKNEKKA